MRKSATHLVAALLIGLTAPTLEAQSVRGTVREQNSGTPLSGVLMTLSRDGSLAAVATVLTNDRGTFVLRAPEPGRYRLGAKRIGVRRFTSDAIELASAQELQMDVELEALVHQLPAVRVEGDPICATRANQVERLYSLWDEARTALTATQVTLRDRLFRARVVRYMRDLNAQNLRVEGERWQRRTEGVVERPFVSLSGEALSLGGYWRTLPNDSIAYYAPDADVLLSGTFARDHCFGIAEGRGDRRGLTGITFEPVSGREVPEVRGTLWLDAKSFELRLVEFRYTRLPSPSNNLNIGGEVHFTKLSTGAWIVEKWFIRMPRYANTPTVRSTGIPGVSPVVEYRLTGLVEEGGTVTVDGSPSRPPN